MISTYGRCAVCQVAAVAERLVSTERFFSWPLGQVTSVQVYNTVLLLSKHLSSTYVGR